MEPAEEQGCAPVGGEDGGAVVVSCGGAEDLGTSGEKNRVEACIRRGRKLSHPRDEQPSDGAQAGGWIARIPRGTTNLFLLLLRY